MGANVSPLASCTFHKWHPKQRWISQPFGLLIHTQFSIRVSLLLAHFLSEWASIHEEYLESPPHTKLWEPQRTHWRRFKPTKGQSIRGSASDIRREGGYCPCVFAAQGWQIEVAEHSDAEPESSRSLIHTTICFKGAVWYMHGGKRKSSMVYARECLITF